MKKIILLFCTSLITLSLYAQKSNNPKLVIGIVVDQMRYDYISKFWNKFQDGGFKRLVSQGYNYKNAHFNYIPTYTAPGHASIYTGTTPAQHGIIANNWFEKQSKTMMYCTQDNKATTVGSSSNAGKMSPKNLLTTTIGDQLKLDNPKSKVVGVSLKDRGAILPAGHSADAAYWFDNESGNWITSSYYMNDLPKWLKKINNERPADKFLNQNWETFLPIEQYTESIEDDNPYEELFPTEQKPIFPHKLKTIKKETDYGLIKSTPFGSTITKDLAKQIIINEMLGSDSNTDFLAISFSATDYVGHQFGTHSKELEDTYLRLDYDLADLLKFLDERIGQNEYSLFLTADHAAVENPSYLLSRKIPGGYFEKNAFENQLKGILNEKYGANNWIDNISNYQVFFNHQLLSEHNISINDITETCINFMIKFEGISNVISAKDLSTGNFDYNILKLAQKGYNQKRSGDIIYVLQPNWVTYSRTGTTHGSPYNYDTHVPLLFFGKGIKQGKFSSDYVSTIDIAPSITYFLDIQMPNGATGTIRNGMLK